MGEKIKEQIVEKKEEGVEERIKKTTYRIGEAVRKLAETTPTTNREEWAYFKEFLEGSEDLKRFATTLFREGVELKKKWEGERAREKWDRISGIALTLIYLEKQLVKKDVDLPEASRKIVEKKIIEDRKHFILLLYKTEDPRYFEDAELLFYEGIGEEARQTFEEKPIPEGKEKEVLNEKKDKWFRWRKEALD